MSALILSGKTVATAVRSDVANRVAAIRGGTAVAYIQDLYLVDTPSNLFQQLLSETVYRSTDLLVVDPRQAGAVPALRVAGTLRQPSSVGRCVPDAR